jgi:16S rRNA (guanine966-N2)-methyltransferase
MFSRLEHLNAIHHAHVLDLYCGSGALGLEAASRGAGTVTLVDSSPKAAAVARKNVAAVGVPSVTVVCKDALKWLNGAVVSQPWDLVFLDPPYDLGEAVLGAVLTAVSAASRLSEDAVIVVERSKRSPEPTWPDGLELRERRNYGETSVYFAAPAGA